MSKIEANLHKALKKACSIEESAPKRKHLRTLIVYTWDHHSSSEVFEALKASPFVNDEIQLFKSLIVLHKIIQEGHPTALKEAIKNREWIRSLGRIHSSGSEYGTLIREYIRYLILKLDFHSHHKGFDNGTFEYEEYVSLVSVADPDEGYETILDLMSLQDSLDQFAQIIFASIQSDRRNSECKISSLIPMIAESYGIYKFITSMLRAMYRELNDPEGGDALQPLRERYQEQHNRLFEFYADCSSIKYLTTLVTIPKLPMDSPNVELAANDNDNNENRTEIKFEKKEIHRQKSPSPSKSLEPSRTASSSVMNPMLTATNTNMSTLIPTATAAAAMMPSMTAQMPQDYWVNQQQQYMNEQAQLEQERQRQLIEQQNQQQQFQQQLQNAQQEMMQLQVQQQSQHQNDLLALTDQYEKDQTLLQQYDQRVQQLESEINTMNENASKQLSNKDEQIESLSKQLDMWEKKYESLAKLYSQLRQEHLSLLPRFKKLQMKVSSAQEAMKQKDHFEQKNKQKDLQMAQLIKERDRARVENDRLQAQLSDVSSNQNNQMADEAQEKMLSISENKLKPMMDAVLENGMTNIQEAIYTLDAPSTWSGAAIDPTFLLSLIENCSERATDFATSFNDLIVDGEIEGDQITVVLNISDFSSSITTLISNFKNVAATLEAQGEDSENIIALVKRCGNEAKYFFEDLLSENLDGKDDEEKTDIVINANVDMQEKLQELSIMIEPFVKELSQASENNPHQELINTANKLEKSSQSLRVNIDVNVPKPLLSMALAIIDAVVSLVRAAVECQNEIGNTTDLGLKEFYKKNHRWTEGLISAAKAVATATNTLINIAGNLVSSDGSGSLEEFIVASREVAASTIQLVAASRVKTSLHSKAQEQLELSSKDVSGVCKALVNCIMDQTKTKSEKDQQPVNFSSEYAVKTAEMEQQVTILKLEQSLNTARRRLGDIRKHAYYLQDDDQPN
ncbi:similar to Saccharomyces cerevisiae YNL243W SLA2 Transmembrane actin-binding protein involved in membrane cytoskeleton assembly and cell polarization [Maudiozyma saulgeensis]|uniref:Similar to Saccharomyces cerevisiae YNL243W SLA2 Transmembrane actin-binding protein involved in membrane cytoskeleton assembly and cell polarization n=1 Tax=Maudiozyma saulgeensis TaxID=1789683 RepID=A0A1X7R251_9SACH|nr:similar to Saccharomyces cerevisiae YNL243W SLA2 Transmembrane actin-binding protein involved in membrane cytoskeleton assembly and cell polarization [Kazachstania saulgeensis]